MTDLGRILGQVQRGENRAQKEPTAQIARQKIGVLALPAQARRLPQGLFHNGGCIDKNLDLAPGLIQQPAPQPLQPPLHQIMVILALRINTHHPAVALGQPGHRIAFRRVGLGQHDDRPRLRPERPRIAAPILTFGHPAHLPLSPFRQKLAQPRGCLRHRIGCTDAQFGKPLGLGLTNQPCLQCGKNIPGVRGLAPGAGIRSRGRHNGRAAESPGSDRPKACGTTGAT